MLFTKLPPWLSSFASCPLAAVQDGRLSTCTRARIFQSHLLLICWPDFYHFCSLYSFPARFTIFPIFPELPEFFIFHFHCAPDSGRFPSSDWRISRSYIFNFYHNTATLYSLRLSYSFSIASLFEGIALLLSFLRPICI